MTSVSIGCTYIVRLDRRYALLITFYLIAKRITMTFKQGNKLDVKISGMNV